MLSDEQIKTIVLHKLFMRRCWGGKHTSFDNLKKGIKVNELGKEGLKKVDKMVKELIHEGLIISKPTSYGLEVSLNPNFSKEIIERIRKVFGNLEL